MIEGGSERGSWVIGQVRWPESNHRWIDDRSKVWPDDSITGSDIISREIGHLKSSGSISLSPGSLSLSLSRNRRGKKGL